MSKASESALADLHGAVALALTAAVAPVKTEEGGTIHASAAHISVAVAFLKNNNITADAEDNTGLAELKKALASRRVDRKEMLKGNVEAAAALEKSLGAGFGSDE